MTCSKDQKVTTMLLKVDLDCCQCYRKVKKVLCKFPQIRDQTFDEKNNTVKITVVCCSPEKIRDKLCCKAGKSIKSIEILKPQPPPSKPPPQTKPAPAPAPTSEPQKPKAPPAPAPAPEPVKQPKTAAEEKPPQMQKNGSKNGSKKSDQPPQPAPKPAPQPEPAPKPANPAPAPAPSKQLEPQAQWVPCYPPAGPPPQAFPVAMCCTPCSEGRPGGPCYEPGPGYPYGYYGRPCPPPPPPYCASRCDYFSEENPAACSIM